MILRAAIEANHLSALGGPGRVVEMAAASHVEALLGHVALRYVWSARPKGPCGFTNDWNNRRFAPVFTSDGGGLRRELLLGQAFSRTVATHGADLILFLEIVMGAGLLAGARLARLGRFRQHAWCQSSIVLINAAVIATMMVPSFASKVYPQIPTRLGKAFHALATTHAALGSVAEILALYILLTAGTNVLPQRLRIANYKRWMRSLLVLWWVALAFGIATYVRWYVPL